ncbi:MULTISPECIES: hypothetical protein [Vibrio]|uniref:hypothetical protein n=1 Tax=Vibrio TaxID=662 RepID=UPI000DE2A656|nr:MULTISPECIES: hypothetical protein [Vibrio]EGQ9321468.1 hypothetical protein [Vibrio cholerae]EGQ9647606.1 hypothetical protein [Vibrio cholerae]EJF0911134.1 hypothetical protein [Vibrio cholerae]EJL6640242.1 hypothetical protein [Vibrio cholerae]ELF6477214.1 hypothetical protein [Vibrio cholerae]
MNSINNSVSPLTLDTIEDNLDKVPSKQSCDDSDFSKILNQVSKVDGEVVESSFELEEDDEEESDAELLEKTRSIEFVEGRGMLNFLFRHPSRNSYIKTIGKKVDLIKSNDNSLQYQQANYNFSWRKFEIEGLKVKIDSYDIEFKIFSAFHFIDANLAGRLERSCASLRVEATYFNNKFKEYIKIEDYKQHTNFSKVGLDKFDLSANYFNQLEGLNRYRVYYKKKYYIFEFDNGRLVNLIRGDDDGS